MSANPWGIEGYGASSYGDAFADVYDDWYGDLGDRDFLDMTLALLPARAAKVLELGVGTGRLLSQIAHARPNVGDRLSGVDSSAAMLERARERTHLAGAHFSRHDFSRSLPEGLFDLVFCGWNTLFNLPDDDAIAATFCRVAAVLPPGGRFAVDAAVPRGDDEDEHVTVRSVTATKVILSVSRHEPAERRITGQFVELADGLPPVLRPWSVRYMSVEGLDDCATRAGMVLESRCADGAGTPFHGESSRHVSVWRKS